MAEVQVPRVPRQNVEGHRKTDPHDGLGEDPQEKRVVHDGRNQERRREDEDAPR